MYVYIYTHTQRSLNFGDCANLLNSCICIFFIQISFINETGTSVHSYYPCSISLSHSRPPPTLPSCSLTLQGISPVGMWAVQLLHTSPIHNLACNYPLATYPV